MTDNPPPLPRPPSQFLSHLANHQQTEARKLLQPYLSYEAWLRRAFARGDAAINNFANLVPIYNGCEEAFRIRNLDRETADKGKYVMSLPDNAREEDSTLAITASLGEYWRNFNGFSHDWSNIVVAGSSALLPLLSRRKGVNYPCLNCSPENYFETIASKSDIDIFLYGLDNEDAAITLIFQLESMVRRNQNLCPGEGDSLRSKNAITFRSPKWPFRQVQIILRLYRSISEILTGFDVDCACVAFDGTQVYSNPRGITAIATRTNLIDLTRRGPAYENRLRKYRLHNFEVFWGPLERERINTMLFQSPARLLNDTQGLARLLLYEQMLQENWDCRGEELAYLGQPQNSVDERGESSLPVLSDYALYEIPYGENCADERSHETFLSHPDDPCLFGTIQEVIEGRKSNALGDNSLVGKVRFVRYVPGQEVMETLQPLAKDDW
ncbi:ankyrin repeat protein [Xylaria bambusicola]|uniref:ankyrin repeat protein n=1 Tax=Xylaria bambusicola TaxID=326684 RepID=UPI002008DA78|nr:ankyrin repeat protein [Xylaria bambusicola]KAI0506333.1 ankyrin repeat protein [Xylaria bambusicola]